MTLYENATIVRECVLPLANLGEVFIRLLRGEAGDAGRHCIHRVQTDRAGQFQSDIVYLYAPSVPLQLVEADFMLLSRGGLISIGQLHHTESMLNRGVRIARS